MSKYTEAAAHLLLTKANQRASLLLPLLAGVEGEAVIVRDTRGLIQYTNHWATVISGWPRRELIGTRMGELPHIAANGYLADPYMMAGAIAMRTGRLAEGTLGLYQPNGSYQWIRSLSKPLAGIGVVTTYRAITPPS